jgi:hypothetical protein
MGVTQLCISASYRWGHGLKADYVGELKTSAATRVKLETE